MSGEAKCCFVSLMLFLGVLGFAVWDSVHQRNKVIQKEQAWIDNNNAVVNVLYVYPKNYKTSTTYYIVVEGSVDKDRREVDAHPRLPLPGEVWTVEVNDQGCLKLLDHLK